MFVFKYRFGVGSLGFTLKLFLFMSNLNLSTIKGLKFANRK
jgi:hypothetical protein